MFIVLPDLLTSSQSTIHQQRHSQHVYGALLTTLYIAISRLASSHPSLRNLHPPNHNLSNQIPTTIPTLALQCLLAHPRCIEPTCLEFSRRSSILIVKPNHRLLRLVALPLANETLYTVRAPRAASRVVAAADSDRSPRPRDQR
jgi:hypothetical protein